jgi:TldD protein
MTASRLPGKGIPRREFIKKSAQGGAVLVVSPFILRSLKAAVAEGAGSGMTIRDLSRGDLEHLLEVALGRGGEFAEIYAEQSAYTRITLEEDKLKDIQYRIRQGVGIRVISDGRSGYAHSADLDMEQLEATAGVAAYIASGAAGPAPQTLTSEGRSEQHWQAGQPLDAVAEGEKVALAWRSNQTARDYDPRIIQVRVVYYDDFREKIVANSRGLWASDRSPQMWMMTSVVAEDGDIRQNGFESMGGRVGWEFFDEHTPEDLAREAARQAVDMLSAREAPSGQMPVVIAAGHGGTMFHESIGHGLEGDGIYKKLSYYSDRLGQRVGSDLVTLIDDATLMGKRGSLTIDDEGIPGQRKVLIENGMLKGFMYDQLSAMQMNTRSTGNGRRESFREMAIPRMTNTFLAPGQDDLDEMIRSTSDGLLVEAIGSGQVHTMTGEFVFRVREAYRIENGQKTYPVRDAILIGNGPEVMQKIDRVGTNLGFTLGFCGKGGQTACVTEGAPEFRISAITVGGTQV